MGRIVLRLLFAAAIAAGLVLGWSTHQPVFDLDRWREAQAEAAERPLGWPAELAAQTAPTATVDESPVPTPSATPTPTSTREPAQTATPTPDDSAPTPTPTSSPDDLPQPPLQSDTPADSGVTDQAIVEAEGGRLDTRDGRLTVVFPPNATSERLEIRVTRRDRDEYGPVSGGHDLFGVWEIQAFAIDRGMEEVSNFAEQVRVIAWHTQADLEGWHPDSLNLWTWNEDTRAWESLARGHEAGGTFVYTDVDHFSIFGSTADPAIVNAPFREAYQTDLHTGASQVTQPIELPPGRGGLTPAFSLIYNSNATNEMKSDLSHGSWLGIGWNAGLGAIRKVYVPGPDNDRYFISFTGASDELLLGDDGVWRTRHNEYLRIRLHGDCDPWDYGAGSTALPLPPCSWTVSDKQGTKYYFGRTDDTGFADPSSARFYDIYDNETLIDPYTGYELYYYGWDLKKIVDPHGNAVIIDYEQVTVEDDPPETSQNQVWIFSAYPDLIHYNFNATLNHYVEIDFVLASNHTNTVSYLPAQSRRDAPRKLSSCGGGPWEPTFLKSAETRYLDRIDVKSSLATGTPQLVRRYDLQQSFTDFACVGGVPTAGTILLDSVLVEGKNGGDLNRMEFDYDKPPACSESNPGRIRLLTSSGSAVETFTRDFLYEAENGFGGLTSYCYDEKSSVPSGEQRWSRQVVTRRELNGRVAGSDVMTSRYTYSDGPAYLIPDGYTGREGEFRGFGYVKETHGAATAPADPYTEHWFYTTGGSWDEFLSGRETEVRVWGGSPVELWRQTEFTWQTREPNGCSDNCGKFAALYRIDDYPAPIAGPGSPSRMTTTYDYDEAGNLVWEHREDVTNGDGITIWRPHHVPANPDDPTFNENWIMLPRFEHVYDDDPGILSLSLLREKFALGIIGPSVTLKPASEVGYFYDGKTNHGLAPSVGNLTATHRWYGEVNVYYKYDEYGNRIEESVPLGTDHRVTDGAPSVVQGAIPPTATKTSWRFDTTHVTFVEEATNPTRTQDVTYDWDKRLGFMTQRTDINGHEINFVPDEFGRIDKIWDAGFTTNLDDWWAVDYVYDWAGGAGSSPTGVNRTWMKFRFSDGSPTDYTWETHCQDGFGREYQVRRSYTSSNDSVSETAYNEQGEVKYQSEPFAHSFLLTACGPTEAISYDKTEFTYTPLGDVTGIVNPDGTSRSIDYEPFEQRLYDEKLHQTVHHYDAFGRLVTVAEWAGTNPPYSLYATTRYDYDVLDNVTATTHDSGDQTLFFYDKLGRRIRMVDPDMGDWDYAYDPAGNLIEQHDARDQYVSFEYDVLNRPTKTCHVPEEACDTASQAPELAATYGYDTYHGSTLCESLPSQAAEGELTTLTTEREGASDIISKWCYDGRGREFKEQLEVDSGTYVVRREYDLADRIRELTYPDGEVLTHTYDATHGHLEDLEGDASGFQNYHYVNGSSTTYNERFQVDWLNLGTGFTTDHVYDERGRLTRRTTPDPGPSIFLQDLNYEYDDTGNVRKILDAVTPETRWFCYDEFDRLTAVAPTSADCAPDYQYDEIGNMTRHNEAGANWYLEYNEENMAHAPLFVDDSANPSAGTIVRAYEYDRNGNVVGVSDDVVNPGFDLAKDLDSDGDGCTNAQERTTPKPLLCANATDPTNTWDTRDPNGDGTIDLFNDILPPDGVAGAFGATPGSPAYARWLDRAGEPPDTYGPDGTITLFHDIFALAFEFGYSNDYGEQPHGEIQFAYDAENRLVERNERGAITTYTYDGQGRLVKKVTPSTTTVYVGGIYEVQGSSVTKYYSFDGRRVAQRTGPAGQTGTLYYLLADHLGSTTTVTNASGYPISSQTYHPYGRTRTGDVSNETDKQFTGHQREADDLYFMQARFYDPYFGSFLQPDTIVPDPMNPQTLNRYAYVQGNPLRYTDPTGRCGYSASDAQLNNAIGLCGPNTKVTYSGSANEAEAPLPSRVPTPPPPPLGTPPAPPRPTYLGPPGPGGQTCTVEVRARPVAASAYHAYIVTTDASGVLAYEEQQQGGYFYQTLGSDIGVGSFIPRSSNDPSALVAKGGSSCGVVRASFDRTASVINELDLPYYLFGVDLPFGVTLGNWDVFGLFEIPGGYVGGPNSNSVVRELLEQAGIRQDIKPDVPLPGWDNQVP